MTGRARRSIGFAVVVFGVCFPSLSYGQQKPASRERVLPNVDIRVLAPRVAPALDADAQSLLEELRRTHPDIRLRARAVGAGARELHANGRPLTGAASGPPEQIARRFLARYHRLLGLEAADVTTLTKSREYRSHDERVVHLLFDQAINGIPVFGGRVQMHLSATGEVLSVASTAAPAGGVPAAAISADDAVRAAISDVRPELLFGPTPLSGPAGKDQKTRFARGPFKSDIDASLVVFPTPQGSRLAWAVVLDPPGLPQKYEVLIDAVTRELLYRRNRVLYADGVGRVMQSDATAALNVKLLDPYPLGSQPGPIFGCPPAANHVVRSLTAPFRDSATVLSDTSLLQGNNTHVYFGVPGTDGASGTSQPDGWHFDFPFNTAGAAETQLFFLTNSLHDFFYDLGFDEASGNFQASNFGRGGLGGDDLAAVARSTAGKNNSTFEPNPDGQVSIMSMYLWDASNCWAQDVDGDGTPDLDGVFDTDIAIHEFHHGVSNRLNTDWTGIEADAMGEGGSDFFAYSINNNTTLAEYAYPPSGIRSINGKTYGAFYCLSFFGFVICEPHDNGEVFADVLWDLRERFRADSVDGSNAAGINATHRLYVDALKLSPPSPTMLDLRDAILQADVLRHPSADPGGSVNHCRIWDVFAVRGMGAAAQDTNDTGTASVVEDFTVGAECPALAPPATVTIAATVPNAYESGVQAGQLRVSRTGDTSGALTVYFTVGGTATPGSDYSPLGTSVTIPSGAATANLAVTPIDDAAVEANETVVVTLTGSVGYHVGTPAAGTVTIVSDDVAPDLTVSSLTVPGTGGAGVALTVSATTKNQGNGAAAASTTKYYLSVNTVVDAADTLLGSSAIGALAPAASTVSSVSLPIPAATAPGTYFIVAQADADGAVAETSEVNNGRAGAVRVGPDLSFSALSGPAVAAAGASITINDTTKNSGGGAAAASMTRFYFSNNTALDAGDPLIGFRSIGALAAGATSAGSTIVTIPASAGTGTIYVIAKADADSAVAETTETNNTSSVAVKIGPDLVLSSLTASGVMGAGSSITVNDTTKNQGGGASVPSVTQFYLSTNTTLDASDVLLGSRAVPALAAAGTSAGATAVTIPAATPTGTYYVVAQADSSATNVETQETNNVASVLVRIGPDLIVSSITGSANAAAGGTLGITESTKNQGGGSVGASTTKYFLSTNIALDAADTPLGARTVPPLGAGLASSQASTLTLPAGIATGAYYVLAQADADNVVPETIETNNVAYLTIHVGPDLVVSALSVSGVLQPGNAFTVNDTTKNQGVGSAGASTTFFYLSTNLAVDAADRLLGSRSVSALAGAATQSGSTVVTLPADVVPGSYYVLGVADGGVAVPETVENNNVMGISVRIGPDLTITTISHPSFVTSGSTASLADTTKSQGTYASNPSTTYLYFSTNSTLDAGDTLLGSRAVPALAPGTTSSVAITVTIPAGLPAGTYYLMAKADGDNTTVESLETNNVATVAVTVKAGP